jgi:drug/metabolite transporter (DMT)-like permease
MLFAETFVLLSPPKSNITMIWEKRWFQFGIMMLLAFVWGSSFILMKMGLKSFTPEQSGALRIVFASVILLPISLKNLKNLQLKDLKSLLIVGFLGSFFPAFMFMVAEMHINSSMAGMLNSLTPGFTLIVGMLFHKTIFNKEQATGLTFGLLGAAGLILIGDGFHFGVINNYSFLIVLATVFYAISLNTNKSHLSHLNGIQVTSLSFFFIGPVALIYLLTTDLASATTHAGWPFHLLALATLGILGTALALLLMNSLIRYSSAVTASSVTYLIPIFAILWGLVDHEQITLLHLFCMALILIGVYLTHAKRSHGSRD